MLKTITIRNQKNFAAGLLYIGFGSAFAIGATFYNMGSAARMGPAYFPFWLGVMLALALLSVLVTPLLRERLSRHILMYNTLATRDSGSVAQLATLLEVGARGRRNGG